MFEIHEFPSFKEERRYNVDFYAFRFYFYAINNTRKLSEFQFLVLN